MPNSGQRLPQGAAGCSARWLTVWIAVAWAAALLLPWFGIEGGLMAIVSGSAKAEQLASAMRHFAEGDPRLLLLFVPPALATMGQIRPHEAGSRVGIAIDAAGAAIRPSQESTDASRRP